MLIIFFLNIQNSSVKSDWLESGRTRGWKSGNIQGLFVIVSKRCKFGCVSIMWTIPHQPLQVCLHPEWFNLDHFVQIAETSAFPAVCRIFWKHGSQMIPWKCGGWGAKHPAEVWSARSVTDQVKQLSQFSVVFHCSLSICSSTTVHKLYISFTKT